MDILNYLASNVPLFSICAVMIYLSIRNLKVRKRESIFFLIFTGIVLFLALVVAMEQIAQVEGRVILGTIFTSCGYILRPTLLFIFILLANMEQIKGKKFYLILGIPLFVNLLIYIFPFFFGVDALSKLVFHYELTEAGTAEFKRGSFLNFSSHLVSGIYLLFLIYLSTLKFSGKHRRDGLVLILVGAIIIITVATEMIMGRSDLLTIVCEICAMINYIFITSVNASRDPLTGLYDRRTYYEDVSKYKNFVNGIVQIDMNGLKYLNDNFGHEAGDIALTKISEIFASSIKSSTMCLYRLSGDEFLILMFQGKNEVLEETVSDIKLAVEETEYSVAIGYYFVNRNENVTYEVALKKAEELMYSDKERYYEISGNDRRRR